MNGWAEERVSGALRRLTLSSWSGTQDAIKFRSGAYVRLRARTAPIGTVPSGRGKQPVRPPVIGPRSPPEWLKARARTLRDASTTYR